MKQEIISLKEINQNELMSKKHKILNHIEPLRILISTVIGCTSISNFASLVDISVGITISAIVLKICVITAGTKKYKLTIKKKNKEVW